MRHVNMIDPAPPPTPELTRAFAAESSVEATPERLAQVEDAMSRLERWDEIEMRSQAIACSRQALPHHGSMPDLERSIAELER